MTAGEGRIARRTALTVGALVLLRLVVAAVTPLAFDEAYYWTWSRSLAGGYYDHPPMVAVLIRLGTSIFGDTEFGVRVAAVLLAVPMSWAVYRTTQILFGDARMAATAVIMLNATLMVAVGTIIVTPDAPLLLAAALVLYALARLHETGRGTWWLAVGVAVGFGLLSKYTAFFFGAEIPLWLLLVKRERRWLLSPWPYLGGVVALALFAPVIVWNAEHHWVSFIKQFGRARADGFTLRYLLEIIPAQIAFATPSVFILGALGLAALLRKNAAAPAARALINVSVWTLVAYFAWHSLHQRVEANWLGPVYPAFAVAAAYAVWGTVGAAARRGLFHRACGAGEHRCAYRFPQRSQRARARGWVAATGARSRNHPGAGRGDLHPHPGLSCHGVAHLLCAEGRLHRPARRALPLDSLAAAERGAAQGTAASFRGSRWRPRCCACHRPAGCRAPAQRRRDANVWSRRIGHAGWRCSRPRAAPGSEALISFPLPCGLSWSHIHLMAAVSELPAARRVGPAQPMRSSHDQDHIHGRRRGAVVGSRRDPDFREGHEAAPSQHAPRADRPPPWSYGPP
jgi:hypothetical protein